MMDDQSSSNDELDKIKLRQSPPSDNHTPLTLAEVAEAKPTDLLNYDRQQLMSRLDQAHSRVAEESKKKDAEILRLRKIEIENARTQHINKSQRWISAVIVVVMTVGGACISTGATSHPTIFGIGWGLVGVGALIQLGRSLLDL